MPDPKPAWPRTHDGAFATTQWTMIVDAARDGDAESERALAKLCETYWPPVYAFIRRRGHAREDAKDLTQGFFALLLEKRQFAGADRTKGKFRTYLLGAVKFFLSDEWDKSTTQKRGGGAVHFSIDAEEAERVLDREMADATTPETLFQQQWVRAIMRDAEAELGAEYTKKGKADTFEMLIPFLIEGRGGGTSTSYQDLAEKHGASDASLRMAANRMRNRYGQLLREKVAATVDSPDEIESEVRYLLATMQK
jgi:RNA polymerase sigma-70 factor (ECF subfamily)